MGDAFNAAAAVIISLGGGGAIVLALSSWLGKVWAARILEEDRLKYQAALAQVHSELDQANRRLQVHFDKALHVHRAQFETEFSAMKTIWEKVMAVRGTMAGLRPMSNLAPLDETPEQRDERFSVRRQEFSAALGELKVAVFNNSPFISESLFRELFDKLLLAARAEDTSVAVHRRDEADWYETGLKNLGLVMNSADKVSQLIRERVRSLAVVPE